MQETKETVKAAIAKTFPNVEDRKEIAETLIGGGFNYLGDFTYSIYNIIDQYRDFADHDVEVNFQAAHQISDILFEMRISFFQVQPATYFCPAENGSASIFMVHDPEESEYIERVTGADTLDEDPQEIIDAIEYIFSAGEEK